ncbi:MAG: hypothetical protein ACJLS3_09815 [Erythrobacter sp.]
MTCKKDPRAARLPLREVVAQGGELPRFTPVPRQCERHDGWTPQRQIAFIEALADTGSVDAACKAVNMSTVGAYHLRRQPGADSFRAAWAAALDLGIQRIEDVAMDRALNGVDEPLYSYGQLIGTRKRYNDRLLMFMLRNRAPERFSQGQPRGLNAVGKMEAERLKKQWRAEWEAERHKVSPAEVRASIDRKVEAIRVRLEAERAALWAQLSDEARAAWETFAALRERDCAAMQDKAAASALKNMTPLDNSPAIEAPGLRWKPEVKEPRTRWTLKDESFDP